MTILDGLTLRAVGFGDSDENDYDDNDYDDNYDVDNMIMTITYVTIPDGLGATSCDDSNDIYVDDGNTCDNFRWCGSKGLW